MWELGQAQAVAARRLHNARKESAHAQNRTFGAAPVNTAERATNRSESAGRSPGHGSITLSNWYWPTASAQDPPIWSAVRPRSATRAAAPNGVIGALADGRPGRWILVLMSVSSAMVQPRPAAMSYAQQASLHVRLSGTDYECCGGAEAGIGGPPPVVF